MKKIIGKIVMMLTLIIAAGCSSGWKHPYKDEAAFYKDKAYCDQQAAKAFPQVFVTSSPTYTTNCSGSVNSSTCTTTPSETTTNDVNSSERRRAMGRCMRALGWET